jgi:hypothetical protein
MSSSDEFEQQFKPISSHTPNQSNQSSPKKSTDRLLSIENFDPKKPSTINSPRSQAAMELLFFSQADICFKDHRPLRDRFVSQEDFEKFVKRENQRVFFHIEKIKEKRTELIKNKEKEEALRKKKETAMKKHRHQLSENQKELKQLEEQLKKEESEIKVRKAKDEDELRLTMSTMRKNKSMINLKAVKPKIDTSSALPSKTKEYFELQGKIKKIKDVIELSEQSKNIIRSRQQRELESLVFSELNIKVDSDERRRSRKSRRRNRRKRSSPRTSSSTKSRRSSRRTCSSWKKTGPTRSG